MMVIRDMTAADLDAVSLLAEQLVMLHHSWDTTRFFTTPDVAKGYRRYFQSQLTEEGVLLLCEAIRRTPRQRTSRGSACSNASATAPRWWS